MAKMLRSTIAGALVSSAVSGCMPSPLHAKEDIQERTEFVGRPATHRLGVEYIIIRGYDGVVLAFPDKNNNCVPTVNFPNGFDPEPRNRSESKILEDAFRKACAQTGAEWRPAP